MKKIKLPIWKVRDLNAAIQALSTYTAPFKFRYAAKKTAALIAPAIQAATEQHGDLFLRDYYEKRKELEKDSGGAEDGRDAIKELESEWKPKLDALEEEIEIEVFQSSVPEISAPEELPEVKANLALSSLLDCLMPMFADENA